MVSVNEVHWANFALQAVRFVNPIFDVILSLFCKKMVALDAKKYFISVLFDFFPWCFVMRALTFRYFLAKNSHILGKISARILLGSSDDWPLAAEHTTHTPAMYCQDTSLPNALSTVC